MFLFETGIDVVNATDLVKEPPKFPNWEPPVKDDPRFCPPKTIKDDPDYHENHVYEFHPECCLLEGTAVFLLHVDYEIDCFCAKAEEFIAVSIIIIIIIIIRHMAYIILKKFDFDQKNPGVGLFFSWQLRG